MPSFREFEKFPVIYYNVQTGWDYIEDWVNRQTDPKDISRLELSPDFQRGHVWTKEQQTAYLEFVISGGSSGRDLYFNHPGWMENYRGDFVLVDGLQRLTAVMGFLHNEIPAYGYYFNDFEGRIPSECYFNIKIAKLKTKKDVLNWYLLMNTGGTPHSKEEIKKVEEMIEKA